MAEMTDEDRKLVILARGAMGRAEARGGAAVRDGDGRTYAGATVSKSTLQLSALQVAVATALSSGATSFEAAVLIGGDVDDPGVATLHEITPDAAVHCTDAAGNLTGEPS
ncbi:MAG: cytidine deaminase [Gordonia sp. (in: high G+C Gram-positive bacteria)]